MAEDLQSLLEKIQRDGVEKAEAEASRILADAKAKADALVKAARDEAAAARVEAERASASYAERAAETVRQAARDVMIDLEGSVRKLLEHVLTGNVDAALARPETVSALMAAVIGEFASKGDIELATSAKLAAALKAQLASRPEIRVIIDETLETGFSVRLDGGRVEHAFTGEVLAGELARRLRPDLAKLVK